MPDWTSLTYSTTRFWLLNSWARVFWSLRPTGALSLLALTIAVVVGFGILAWVRKR